jgi:hypothetical protein
MAEDTGDRAESSWLLEPPGADEVHIEIGIGAEADLSPEARAALDRLLDELGEREDVEVAAFECSIGPCSDYHVCSTFKNCRPRETSPSCFRYVHCRITKLIGM